MSKCCHISTFLFSHFDSIKRLFGSGAFDIGCLAPSQENQSSESCIQHKKNEKKKSKQSVLCTQRKQLTFIRVRFSSNRGSKEGKIYTPDVLQSQHVEPSLLAIYVSS